jgi:hypothetical protein
LSCICIFLLFLSMLLYVPFLLKHHPSILPLSTLPSFPFLSLLPFFILNGFPSQFVFHFHLLFYSIHKNQL